EIYIRDVRAEATFFDSTLPVVKIPGIKYYFSEVELFLNPEFNFLSNDLIIKTYKNYHERKLIPTYTFTTLTRRLESLYGNKSEAKFKALNFWADYHLRF
ncbi:MAG: hypothetical protein Q7U04_08835, partial [Bacteriovorax sp.]|nr:hypothetical protein [Bacteriovorax sp.]